MTQSADAQRSAHVADIKRQLLHGIGDVARQLSDVERSMRAEVAAIVEDVRQGRPVWPEVEFRDIVAGRVPEQAVAAIRRRGCAVIRQTFPEAQARAWDDEIVRYLDENDFQRTYRSMPNHMPTRPDGEPLMFPVYWSRPQVAARQDARLNATRAFMNSIWKSDSEGHTWFDGAQETTYADKFRRRRPRDPYAGLVPHIDAGATDRWTSEGYRRVYRHVYAGDWRDYDPWDGAFRTSDDTYSLFRSFQGWTALSEMQPQDGVLHVVPIANAVVQILLRSLMPDVPEGSVLHQASFHPTFELDPAFHGLFYPALVPCPAVKPGDTVWWHTDLVHSVADVTGLQRWGNVMYIASAPACDLNRRVTAQHLAAFLKGDSPSASVPSLERAWKHRATVDDLSAAGRRQFGLDA